MDYLSTEIRPKYVNLLSICKEQGLLITRATELDLGHQIGRVSADEFAELESIDNQIEILNVKINTILSALKSNVEIHRSFCKRQLESCIKLKSEQSEKHYFLDKQIQG